MPVQYGQQALQPKLTNLPRLCLKSSWFMINKQIHNNIGVSLLQDWIKTQFIHFHFNLDSLTWEPKQKTYV